MQRGGDASHTAHRCAEELVASGHGASEITWIAKQIDGKKSAQRLLNTKAAPQLQAPSELSVSGG